MTTSHSLLASRRAFTRGVGAFGLAAAFGALRTATAFAAPGAAIDDQAEWAQKYDGDERLNVQRATTPILSQQTVAATEAAIQQYHEIAAQGGWSPVPASQTLKLGAKGGAVIALRKRLMVTGDLDSSAGLAPVFDSFVQAGVQRFQTRHGIGPSGVVAAQTFKELNVSVEDRIRQLELNVTRLRSLAGNLGPRYVALNIPAAMVETVENGVVFSHHQAGVGKIDRQSPIMQTKALEVNFNPFWTVPASIIRKDLIPKMQHDANYLSDNKIRVINAAGQEVAPTVINWNSLDATHYRFRQDPGADVNSLGVVRVNINNPYGVYMHDTPSKGVFGDDFRFVSSGCVRVQNIRDYITWLLKDTPGWDRDHIDEAIRSGARIDARLSTPVPVYWTYVTAWAGDGLVQFREDIYQKDGLGADVAMIPESAQPAPAPSRGAQLAPMDDHDRELIEP